MSLFARLRVAILVAVVLPAAMGRAQALRVWMAAPAAPAAATKDAKPAHATTRPARSDARPRLELLGGDFLPGEIADSEEAGLLAWQCDAMVRPFVFPLSTVRFVHFPTPAKKPTASEGAFRIELVGGDILYGEVTSLSADALVVDSPQFGALTIDRKEVRIIERTGASGGILYTGPDGVADWQQADSDGAAWREDSGALATDDPGRLSLTGNKFPAKISIEVELAWRDRADFSLAFTPTENPTASLSTFAKNLLGIQGAKPAADAPTPKYTFELAAWDDALMLVSEGDEGADVARVVHKLGRNSRVELQIFVDPDEKQIIVYSLSGEELARVTLPADAIPKTEGVLSVTNRLGDVRLERLVVRRWNGAAPGAAPRDRAFVQLAKGEVLAAENVRLDAGDAEVLVTASQGEDDEAEETDKRVPLANVARIAFPPPKEPRTFALRVSQQDGIRVSGNLLKVEHGQLVIERPGVEGNLSMAVADLRSVASLTPEIPAGFPDGVLGRLEVAGGVVRGALASNGDKDADLPSDSESCLVWKPMGSTTASPLKPEAAGRIVYREPPPVVVDEQQAGAQVPVAARPPGFLGGMLRAFTNPTAAAALASAADAGDQLLWLKAGDRIPCTIESIDERGVTFKTTLVESTFVPHSAVKAWDAVAGSRPRDVTPDKQVITMEANMGRQPGVMMRQPDPKRYLRLLTLPRMQRENPPTHLIEATNGDFLRGRLVAMNDDHLTIEVRMEPKLIPRSAVTRIIWLDNPNKKTNKQADKDEPTADADDAPKSLAGLEVQAVRSDGVRLTFRPTEFAGGALKGTSDLLGACHVDMALIDELIFGAAIADAASGLAYSEWHLRSAPDPRFASEGQGGGAPGTTGLESAMVGEPAPDFTLESSTSGKFQLSGAHGRVIVLDFWASWCGPCKAAMPQIRDALGEFDQEQVEWIAVNLQEDEETAAKALERIGVSPRIAFDIDGAAAEKFQVTAIPHTAVVDPNGKVTAVFIGSSPSLSADLRAAVTKALEPPQETKDDAAPE